MATVAWQAEKDLFKEFGGVDIPLSDNPDVTEFFSKEAVMATKRMKLRAIIMNSYTGRTARYVSSFRGQCTILAICYKAKTVRHLALSYGVYAIYMPMKSYGHEFLLAALRKLLSDNMLCPEDRICYLGSQRKEQRTSFMEMNIVKNLFESEGEETYPNLFPTHRGRPTYPQVQQTAPPVLNTYRCIRMLQYHTGLRFAWRCRRLFF